MGDIHQPLHTVTRYTRELPDGDMGGNLYPLNESFSNQSITELHALWDSVVTSFDRDVIPPFSADEWAWIGEAATNITQENPRTSFTESELESPVDVWIAESFEIAKTVVYRGITENGLPSKAYIEEGTRVAWRQLAKGGYRLANVLVKLWGSSRSAMFLE